MAERKPAPPPPTGPSATASAPPPWGGGLAKGGVPVCELVCLDGPDAGAPPGSAAATEPAAWPAVLDVTLRTDVAYVLGTVLAAAAPGSWAVRRLVPAAAGDRAARSRFIEFLNSLASRRRAGVVAGLGGGRQIYLIPPSGSVAERLGAVWSPNECVFGLVAPE